MQSPISRTASGGAAGSGASVARTSSAGLQRTASAGNLKSALVQSPISRTASAEKRQQAQSPVSTQGGSSVKAQSPVSPQGGSSVKVSFTSRTSVQDILERIQDRASANASDQNVVRHTKTSQVRVSQVQNTALQKAVDLVQKSGIEAARGSLFSSASFRAVKRSISKAKEEELQMRQDSEAPKAKDLGEILLQALKNTGTSGASKAAGMLSDVVHPKFTRVPSSESDKADVVKAAVQELAISRTASISSITSHGSIGNSDEACGEGWMGDVYNQRVACDIFEKNVQQDPENDDDNATEKRLTGKLTNTIDVTAILSTDDEADDAGKDLARQTYVSLMIGDWHAALDCLKEFKLLTREELGTALRFKDDQGNTLMHRATMDSDEPSTDLPAAKAKGGIRFEDSSDQMVREKILEVNVHFASMQYDL